MTVKRFTLIGISIFSCCTLALVLAQTTRKDPVRINQIQMIGSHNSYHTGLAPSEAKLMMQRSPDRYAQLEYRHQPLDQQLSSGIRQIELDVYADSEGGRYADPLGPKLVAQAGLPTDPPFDPNGIMKRPGFKVMHVQDFDVRSTCQPFVACLQIVRQWSHAHPSHLPIFILVETKQTDLPPAYRAVTTEKFTSATFDALDAEIRSVFPPQELIIPDDVRGSHATLQEAVLNDGWPTVEDARGKIIFLMDQQPVSPVYLENHLSLRGRVIFTNGVPGEPDCAFTEENDGTPEEISALVRKGYLVRTRTDIDTKEARTNSTVRRDGAFASGAQLLSTDYPASEPSQWSSYQVSLPGNATARCNPVNGPATCSNRSLEDRAQN